MKNIEGTNFEATVPYETHEVCENMTQKALIEVWAEQNNLTNSHTPNEVVQAWITSGMAEQYRAYADRHPEETIDIYNEQGLTLLLKRLEEAV